MTFEQYLLQIGYNFQDAHIPRDKVLMAIKHAENWHNYELKEMRIKGANTTNSKYSKEERSEWAKKGGYPKGRKRKPVDNSLIK